MLNKISAEKKKNIVPVVLGLLLMTIIIFLEDYISIGLIFFVFIFGLLIIEFICVIFFKIDFFKSILPSFFFNKK
jgi:hypothetical protein